MLRGHLVTGQMRVPFRKPFAGRMAVRVSGEPSPGRFGLSQRLPTMERETPSSESRKRSRAMQARRAHLHRVQPTTHKKDNNLDRIEQPLYMSYICFTGKDHR